MGINLYRIYMIFAAFISVCYRFPVIFWFPLVSYTTMILNLIHRTHLHQCLQLVSVSIMEPQLGVFHSLDTSQSSLSRFQLGCCKQKRETCSCFLLETKETPWLYQNSFSQPFDTNQHIRQNIYMYEHNDILLTLHRSHITHTIWLFNMAWKIPTINGGF
jgi:hypothetical protein